MHSTLLSYAGMSATVVTDSSVVDPVVYNPTTETGETSANEAQLEKECRKISTSLFDLLSEGVDEQIITEKDRRDYMTALSDKNLEAGGATTWQQKKEMLEENLRKYAPNFVSEARKMADAFLADITKAQQKGWISKSSAERWYKRLHKRSMNWADTKEFLKKFNEKYMANWEKVATKKAEVESKVKELNVTVKDIPELKELGKTGFDDLHYTEKSALVDTVLAALAVHEENIEKNKELFKRAQSMLRNEVKLGVIRRDQEGEWMESLFNRKRSPDEIEGILKGTLAEYIGNWAKVRYRYDRVMRRMENGIPPGTEKLDEKAFLNLSYPEKESYVQEAEYALNLIDKGFSDRPIDKMKLEIRSLMAQKDWEGAQEVLSKAHKIAEGEDIYELNSMENTIRLYANKGETQEETPNEQASQVLENIRTALDEVPSGVRSLYIKALQAGPQVFSSLSTYLYNRVWCWDHGYLNADTEQQLEQNSVAETQDIVEHGHRKHGLENINLDTVDEIDKSKAMRPYKRTWAPTVYHLDATNGSSCGALINELQGKDAARDYWSTLILKNISYDKHRELVKGANHRIKSNIRKLHKMGFAFTMVGPPQSIN